MCDCDGPYWSRVFDAGDPSYTSSVSILIDAKKVGMTATTALEGSLTFETGAVDSQLQILTSDKLAANVAQRLGLQNNPAFIDPAGSALSEGVQKVTGAVRTVIRKVTGAESRWKSRICPKTSGF